MIEFRVDAIPKAQPRQRMAVRGKHAVSYTPQNHPVNTYKAALQMACPRMAPIDGPLSLAVVFVLPRPKAMQWKTRPTPRVLHAKKPDADNLIKSTKDALNGMLWRDDSQVAKLTASKWIAAGDEQPHVTIQVEALTDAN